MKTSLDDKMLKFCIMKAKETLIVPDEEEVIKTADLSVHAWEQSWPNASCGEDAKTSLRANYVAPTVLIIGPAGDACVFHNGKLAGYTEEPDSTFLAAYKKQDIPGKSSKRWWDNRNNGKATDDMAVEATDDDGDDGTPA